MKSFGLFGEKLGHSLSPEIHRIIFEELNIKGTYNLFEINKENFHKAIDSVKTLNIKGVNVTIPYKEDIIKQLDFVSSEAKRIGAINTIKIVDNKAFGYNTDYYGFGYMISKGNITIKDNDFYVLGAGGAAKAVISYLEDKEAKSINLISRNKESAKISFENFNINVISYNDLKDKKGYCIINTTPVGMYPKVDFSPVNKEIITNFNFAMDIVYNPLETRFLKMAKELGLKCVDGLYMLVGQGVKAEEIWNDIKINDEILDIIYKALKDILVNKGV
ncbi:MAG: shikimate dehydrogenase [Clostridium perfringens]|nr:shikimate dehydrogenase [Clostridium perfringens]